MDPNHWNYNPGYGRLTSSGLPTSHSGINFPILDQATITSGLGLPTGLPTHGALGSRSLPTLPAVNYHGHPLHNSVSQFLDPINSLQAANYAGQSPYKPITSTASPFTLDASNRAIADLNIGYSGSRYSVSTPTSSGLSNTSSKSSYFPSDKDQGATFSAAAQAVSEANLKGWGLSNFVQFGDISPSFPAGVQSSQPAPPPAHSTGNSGRVSSLSRNPFPGDESFTSRSKSSDSSHSHPLPSPSPYQTSNVQRSRSTSSHPPVVSTPNYSASPPEIEDLSSHSQNQIYGSYPNLSSAGYSTISSNNPIYSSQLHPDMNYDPVSPVTPVSHSPPPSSTDPFNTVSLQDIESMGAATHLEKSRSSRKDLLINEHAVDKLNKRMIKESSNLLHSISGRSDRSSMGSMSNLAMQHQQKSSSIHNGKSKPSPMQQSPISVGSPQAPLSSPSTTMSTSTFTPTPTPVQAVPDSTTKPKSRKPRKKKSDSSNPSNFIPGASQPSYTTPTPTPTLNQPTNRNFSADMSYRNTLQHPPPFNQSSSSRSVSDTPLSPLQRQIPGNIVEQMQATAMSQNIGEEMVPMHRMPSLTEDLINRHSSIAENPHSSIHSSQGGDNLAHISSHSGHAQVSPLVTSPQIPVNHMIEASILSQTRPSQDTGQRSYREQGPLLSNVFVEGDLQSNQNQFDMNGYSGHTFLEELNSQSAPNIENFTGEMMVERQNFHASMLEMGSYGQGHYGMTPSMEQVDMNNPMHLGTIDESTFTSLLDQEAARRYRAPEPKLTFAIPIEQDDELSNFSRPPPHLPPTNSFINKPQKLSAPQNAFNESFINFVKGKKPETLSSVNSVPHKKPQLPKYFPEPRRRIVPKPPEPKEEESKTSMSFSDDEDSDLKASDAMDELLSESDSDSDISAEYTVKKQNKSTKKIPPLVIKKKVIQSKAKPKPSKAKKSRKSVDQDYSFVADQFVPVEVEVAEPRTLISRKAKEKALEKSAKKKKTSDDSSSEESEPEYIPRSKKVRSGSRLSADYDSDDDPAWMPFAVDLKDQVEDEGELKKRRNRNRQRSGGGVGRQRNKSQPMARRKTVESSEDSHQELPARTPESANRKTDDKRMLSDAPLVKQAAKSKQETPHKSSVAKSSRVPDAKNRCREENEEESFQVGRFLIEKKDLHNYETYPIWRIEQGGMIHKYEIFPEEGNIRHMSVSTYSSWMPIMKDQFIPIRVAVLMEKNNKSIVEVLDEYKPKPPTDGSLENKYEEDPLVDLFNVYLQIFLSQALEPSFLRAIKDSQEHFYLVPLDKVDKMIDRKLDEIDRKVKWKPYFKECLKCRPGLKERDRPNLKQSCQACENSSPPTIKSLHLLGQPYDRFLLQTLKSDTNESASVFMIGKTASQYVSHYHSLYHFKYMLYQRCLAKIRIIRESDPSISNEHILDQCLQNRAWVLKIFHDLKELLEKV